MRISGGLSDLYGPESYRRQEPKVQSEAPENKAKPEVLQAGRRATAEDIPLRSVLSTRELNTLEAFFGDPNTARQTLYGGHGQPKNVHSGMLLDVKG